MDKNKYKTFKIVIRIIASMIFVIFVLKIMSFYFDFKNSSKSIESYLKKSSNGIHYKQTPPCFLGFHYITRFHISKGNSKIQISISKSILSSLQDDSISWNHCFPAPNDGLVEEYNPMSINIGEENCSKFVKSGGYWVEFKENNLRISCFVKNSNEKKPDFDEGFIKELLVNLKESAL
jgi:hypothetical protein